MSVNRSIFRSRKNLRAKTMPMNRSLFRHRKARAGGVIPPAFTPLSLAGCVLWLDGNDLTTLPNDPVDVWNDKSVEGNNALEIVGIGLGEIDGWGANANSCVKFDLVNLGMLQITGDASLTNSAYTLYTVVERLNALDGNGIAIFEPSSGCQMAASYYSDMPPDYFAVQTCDAGTSSIDIQPAPQYLCAGSLLDSNAMDTRLNGAPLLSAQTTFTDTGSNQDYLLGGYFDGVNFVPICDARIGEIVVYSRKLTGGEITQLENYLLLKWGI